jgi:hypothetical protein
MQLLYLLHLDRPVSDGAQELLQLINFHLAQGLVLLTRESVRIGDGEKSGSLGYAIFLVKGGLTFFHFSEQ